MTQERFFELVYAWNERDLTGDELYKRVFTSSDDNRQRELFINFTKKVIKYYEEMYIGDYDLYKEATELINNLNE